MHLKHSIVVIFKFETQDFPNTSMRVFASLFNKFCFASVQCAIILLWLLLTMSLIYDLTASRLNAIPLSELPKNSKTS